MNASPPNRANGKMERPSVHDRDLPKKRVIITTISVGIKVPVIACSVAAYVVMVCLCCSKVIPAALS